MHLKQMFSGERFQRPWPLVDRVVALAWCKCNCEAWCSAWSAFIKFWWWFCGERGIKCSFYRLLCYRAEKDRWAVVSENVPSDICAQWRLKWACASVQSDKKNVVPWRILHLGYPILILIGLRECARWSKSSLGADVRRHVFWRCGSINAETSKLELLLVLKHSYCRRQWRRQF